jgi:hypothetical protein
VSLDRVKIHKVGVMIDKGDDSCIAVNTLRGIKTVSISTVCQYAGLGLKRVAQTLFVLLAYRTRLNIFSDGTQRNTVARVNLIH